MNGVYVPVKELWTEDILSRACGNAPCAPVDKELADHVDGIQSFMSVSKDTFNMITEMCTPDDVLQSLMAVITQGWPKEKAECPKEFIGIFGMCEMS
ncbi:hypothetical protein BgiMline_016038 [Biomphalaria glabrata]|nr:hypothetical protein BgiMline_008837 [Biomphalaria glabrata]